MRNTVFMRNHGYTAAFTPQSPQSRAHLVEEDEAPMAERVLRIESVSNALIS